MSDTMEPYSVTTIRQVIDSIPGSVYWKDASGVYLGCNTVMVETAKLTSKDQIVGKTDFELWPQTADKVRENDLEAMLSGEVSSVEERVQLPNNGLMHFRSVKIPLRDDHNNIVGVIGNSLDITAEKKAEQLEREKFAAQEKAKVMKFLAGTIAHEIRTPLSTISAISESVRYLFPAVLQLNSKAKELGVEQVLSEIDLRDLAEIPGDLDSLIKKTGNFVDMLLQKVRLDEGKIESYEVLSIAKALEVSLQSYHDTGGVRLEVHDIIDFKFKGELVAFTHVIFNLLKNAIYHVRKSGSGKIEIWTELAASGNILHFRDTGTGIPKQMQGQIFDHFYSKTRHGTGIGLAYCKLVMQGFGGDIFCQSEYGEYAHFEMVFPVLSAADMG